VNGSLFLLIGPTGVGKNTLISKVLPLIDSISFLPSFTSRSMRSDEQEGKPYFFVDRNEFERRILNNDFIEWKFVHGNNYYGIGKSKAEDVLKSGKNLITDIEVLGAIDIIDYLPRNCVSIFVGAGSKDDLVNRIIKRGSLSEDDLNIRMERIEFEMRYENHFDYFVYNDNLDECVNDLVSIIQFEIHNSKYRIQKHASSILHYFIIAMITNLKNEILLVRQKSPILTSNWSMPSTHVLKDESPKDALYRELHFIFTSISQESKDLIYMLTPISEEKRFLENHYHYEIEFKLVLDLPLIQKDNYEFKWFSLAEAKKYLGDDFVI